ncbi:LCP family protein [Alkalibacter mobilis]|uniref:LCP family protein n=1 Tax=Alkalibacter mobilis TaxID=2787712 RepID=UPI0018A086A9|nr:LCP family protein [Alkalibacter mobilis]MBF7097346.1 LCP family protein [Alkalibacter mobilis]
MKRKKIWITVIIIILVLALATGKFILDAMDYKTALVPDQKTEEPENMDSEEPEVIQGQNSKVEDENDYLDAIGTPSSNKINILFLGIDESKDRNIGIYRSDIIVIARLDLDLNMVKIISIPRDTRAYLPIRDDYDKLGHAYAFGSREGMGPEASAEAVSKFVGDKPIDYYFAIKMDPVPDIVNDIGGVDINVEVEMYDSARNVRITKGIQRIDGDQALLYLQWRSTPGGDIDRILRVQNFLASLYGQLKNDGQVIEAMKIVINYKEGTQTNLTSKQMLALAAYMKQLPEGAITYYTLSGRSKMIDGKSFWIPDDNTAVLEEFFADENLKVETDLSSD